MAVNELLRAHVTRVGFNLQLTKNQIAALIQLDVELSDPRTFSERVNDPEAPGEVARGPGRHLLSANMTSRNALIARGLVSHRMPPEQEHGTWVDRSLRDSWAITPAGRSVVDLLKDSGLYEEVSNDVPWRKAPTPEQSGFDPAAEIARLRTRAETAEGKLAELRGKVTAEQRKTFRAEGDARVAEAKLARLQERVRDMLQAAGASELMGADHA